MNHYYHKLLLRVKIPMLLLLLLWAGGVSAQRFHFHNLTVDDGLIQSQATCMAQDKTGNLWVGTLGGLSRYDGRNFTNYTVRNGLLHNMVRAIATDGAGNIWTSGPLGLSCYNGRVFTHYPMQVQTRSFNTTQQISITKDTTWWRVQGEVYYVTKGKIKYFVTPGGEGFVSAMLVRQTDIWIAKEGKVYCYSNGRWDTLAFADATEGEVPVIYKIFEGKEGKVWMAGNYGLYGVLQDRVLLHRVNESPLDFLPGISCGAADNNGDLWVGTNNGAVRITATDLHYYNKRNGLTDNSLNDIIRDAEGNIWMATDGQGIFRFSGTQFTGLDETMGLPSAQVMAIANNGSDSLLIGTYDAGLYVFKDNKVMPLSFPSNPVPAITALCYTPTGLWIGTRGRGLWSYDEGIFRQYAAPERDFPSNYVHCIYNDTFNRMWIGFNNGVIVLEDGMFKIADTNTSPVYSFLTIGYDSTLIATDAGLRLFHAGEVHPFETGTIIDSSVIQCFVMRGNDLWMGSSDNGLIAYNLRTGKTNVINKNKGLRSDFIYNLVTDDNGNLWAGTGYGIHKIMSPNDVNPQIVFYGKAQGIMGMESNINSVKKMNDGSIWFGTTNGALHYSPHTPAAVSAPSCIVLQMVKIAGENVIDSSWYDGIDNWYGIPHNLRLPYKKNNIAFTFQAITLSGAQQVLYRYRIDGLDVPWSDWSSTNSVTYSALPPGNYIFRVQCRSDAGISTPELVYAFEIITPFHKTIWFSLVILLACITSGILLQYSINRSKERRAKLLAKLRAEEQGKIRTRTAEDFHDEIGNKLTRINVLTNVLKKKIEMTPETTRILGQIEDNTGQLYSGTRDILWSLKPSNDVLYEILHRIRDFGTELFQDTEIQFVFTGTDEKWQQYRLNMEMSRNLIMIFKEALNNSLKYAKPTVVTLEVTMKQKGVLHMVLKDNGVGFDVQTTAKGNGLNNMKTRAGRLNGKLYVDSTHNKGTIISLTFKIPQNR